ncbi:hypothetical protein AB0F42_05755 [Streptomyces buecherae]|uniref:hypothetical protein n=1 Tax=Streptomyces buecherae TaxID=2763006 RepID=UPI0033EDD2F0
MSRESDSSSSGPQGRGDAAYPSGTPPYGSRQYPSPHPTQEAPYDNADADGPRPPRVPEEPRTETTLTTRIRINIPGSRPIPPVVVRKPVGDDDSVGSGSGSASGAARESDRGGQRPGGAKAGGSGGARPGGQARGAGRPGGSAPGSGSAPSPASPGSPASAVGPAGGTASGSGSLAGPGDPAPGEGERKASERTSDWFAPRKPRNSQAGASPPTPAAPSAPTPETTQETTQPFPAFGADGLPGDGAYDDGFAGRTGPEDPAGQGGYPDQGAPGGHADFAGPDPFGAGGPGPGGGQPYYPDYADGQHGAGPGGPGGGQGDPLTDPLPDPLTDPLPDPLTDPLGTFPGSEPEPGGVGGADAGPLRPRDRSDLPYDDWPVRTDTPADGFASPWLGGQDATDQAGPAGVTGGPTTGDMPVSPPDFASGPGPSTGTAPGPDAPGAPFDAPPGAPGGDALGPFDGPGRYDESGRYDGFDTPGGPAGPPPAGGGPFDAPGALGSGPGGPVGPGFDTPGGPFDGPGGPGGPSQHDFERPAAGGAAGDTTRLTPQQPRKKAKKAPAAPTTGAGAPPGPGPGASGGLGATTRAGQAANRLPGEPELTESEREAKAALDALAAGKRPSGPPVSGNTVVSGVPATAPGGASEPPASQEPPKPAPAPAPSGGGSKPKKKGRSKLVMAGVGIVGVVCVAYGAGLVLGHADVPNGTTVLGIDIGGTSKEEAVEKLDTQLGNRTTAPMKVSVDGEQLELKPSVAGLSIDTEATVRDTAGRDYNPVTVIGSLFGGTREAEAKVKVDEEKLRDALGRLAGEGSGSAREGTITFEPGRAVPVYGKAGKGLDADKSVDAVAQAYRDRAESGENRAVALPSTTRQPKVSNAEVDRKMKTFAEPAMSGLITVQAGGQEIQFGPDRSLPRILSMRVVDGKLVEHYDLDAIKQLYGSTFDGVLVERGDGSRTPVSPTDVAGAMGRALTGKTLAERTVAIPNTTLG